MSQMNPSIILAGQAPDIVGQLARGTQAGMLAAEAQRGNALSALFREQGPGIAAGDPQALNALARIDPNASVGFTERQQALKIGEEQLQTIRANAAREAQAYTARMSAAERAEAAEQTERGLAAAMTAKSAEEWDALAQQFGAADLVGQYDMREAVIASMLGVAETLKNTQPAAPEWRAATPEEARSRGASAGQINARTGEFKRTPVDSGISLSVGPDGGVTLNQGPGASLPSGQNPATTATPRNAVQLGKDLSKNDAEALKGLQDAATTATQIESLATQLETIAPNVGYTGPFGDAYGAIDDAVKVLPGDEAARGAFRSLGMEAQLSFTEKTKGAITDREMAMFRQAIPSLSQTPEGNTAIAQVMRAGAKRVQDRAAFFENWGRKNGSLEGAQEVWSEYMRDNPVIDQKGGTIAARDGGDWRSYLNRKPANAYTPQAIMGMGPEDLAQIPVEKMTIQQLEALEARYNQLRGQGGQ